MRPTGKQLYEWAKGLDGPTVKEASEYFVCTMKVIREVIEEADIDHETGDSGAYLGLGVAISTHAGYHIVKPQFQVVEAYSTTDEHTRKAR